MAENGLRIWWLTEPECRAIGDPYDTSDPDEEPEAIEEGQANLESVDLANVPWPAYIKKQYRLLYGSAPHGRLFIADELQLRAEAVVLFVLECENRLIERCKLASGIVIRAEDAMTVLPYGGFMTDEEGRYSA